MDYSKLSGLSAEVKADLRKHHFYFGTDGKTDQSMCKESYVHHPGDHRSSMDPDQKKQLRTHHFSFGEDDYKPREGRPGISSTSRDALQYHGLVDTAWTRPSRRTCAPCTSRLAWTKGRLSRCLRRPTGDRTCGR